jgi:hypothetical protein
LLYFFFFFTLPSKKKFYTFHFYCTLNMSSLSFFKIISCTDSS